MEEARMANMKASVGEQRWPWHRSGLENPEFTNRSKTLSSLGRVNDDRGYRSFDGPSAHVGPSTYF
jgi:hypothetical protein